MKKIKHDIYVITFSIEESISFCHAIENKLKLYRRHWGDEFYTDCAGTRTCARIFVPANKYKSVETSTYTEEEIKEYTRIIDNDNFMTVKQFYKNFLNNKLSIE